MTPKRTIIFVVALVLALLAGGLAYLFLNNAQQQAFNNAKLEPAFVVTKAIPRGMSGSSAVSGGYFAEKKVPAEIRPDAVVTDLTSLAGKTSIADFPAGEILVDGMFASPSQAQLTFSQVIPAGDVAVTVSVDAVHGVADLPQPGDEVDILVTNNGAETLLLQNVPILAIGQTTAGQSSTSTASTTTNNGSGLYTFAATPTNAERIALAQEQDLGIYLLLVPPNNPVISLPAYSPGNILSGPQS